MTHSVEQGRTLRARIELLRAQYDKMRTGEGLPGPSIGKGPIMILDLVVRELDDALLATQPTEARAETLACEFHDKPKRFCGDCANELVEPGQKAIAAFAVAITRIRTVAKQYGIGGHTHREKMLNALADEFESANFTAPVERPERPTEAQPNWMQQEIADGVAPGTYAPTEARTESGAVQHMVNRFLSWKLPENFNPDGGISFKKVRNENTSYPAKNEPVGTNLFDADQAKEMVRYMVEGLAVERPERPTEARPLDELAAKWRKEVSECCPILLERKTLPARCAGDTHEGCRQKLRDADELEAALLAATEAHPLTWNKFCNREPEDGERILVLPVGLLKDGVRETRYIKLQIGYKLEGLYSLAGDPTHWISVKSVLEAALLGKEKGL